MLIVCVCEHETGKLQILQSQHNNQFISRQIFRRKYLPGFLLFGRQGGGSTSEVRLRPGCCPGMASSASSIIRFWNNPNHNAQQIYVQFVLFVNQRNE